VAAPQRALEELSAPELRSLIIAATDGSPEAAMRVLVADIYDAMGQVAANAVAARESVAAVVRQGIIDAASEAPSPDDILAEIDAAEARKVSALETEAVAADSILDLSLRVFPPAKVAAAAADTPLPLLIEHARAVDAALSAQRALPCGAVEPTAIAVVRDSDPADAAPYGRGSAPPRVTAADVAIESMPLCIRLGRPVVFVATLRDSYASRGPEDLRVALASLERHLRVVATLEQVTGPPRTLSVKVARSAERAFSVTIGDGLVDDAGDIFIESMHVAGHIIPDVAFPLRIPVSEAVGVSAPQVISSVSSVLYSQPCISRDGRLYLVRDGQPLRVFDPDGKLESTVSLEALGLQAHGRASAVASWDDADAILVTDGGSTGNGDDNGVLLALDATSHVVRWSVTVSTSSFSLVGIAPLPSFNVIFASNGMRMAVRRLSDGADLSRFVQLPPLALHSLFVACDDESGHVYYNSSHAVYSFLLSGDSARYEIVDKEKLTAADGVGSSNFRPITVVPPAPGCVKSYLVCGAIFSSTLRVLSIPEHTLVHTHDLEGVQVSGMAGDPSGTALAVHDLASGGDVRIVSWPLPGMTLV
jgi:hypothetical protein